MNSCSPSDPMRVGGQERVCCMDESFLLGVIVAGCIAAWIVFRMYSSRPHDLRGLSRVEAKLDALMKHEGIRFDPYSDVPPPVVDALRRGKEDRSNQALPGATGAGLKEAKEFVEELQRRPTSACSGQNGSLPVSAWLSGSVPDPATTTRPPSLTREGCGEVLCLRLQPVFETASCATALCRGRRRRQTARARLAFSQGWISRTSPGSATRSQPGLPRMSSGAPSTRSPPTKSLGLTTQEGLGSGYVDRTVAVESPSGPIEATTYVASSDATRPGLKPYTWYKDFVLGRRDRTRSPTRVRRNDSSGRGRPRYERGSCGGARENPDRHHAH